MESIVVYKSIHHGNTEKVAKAIATVLEADCLQPEKVDTLDIVRRDLVGFGSGIYYGSFHESILNLVERLPEVEEVKAFLFSTSGFPKVPIIHDFGSKMEESLEKKEFEVIGHFSCRGWETYIPVFKIFGGVHKGRPNEEDLVEAEKFAKQLVED